MRPRHVDVDVAVVGAGHNALVAAAYLARAGARVMVFERTPRLGGAMATVDWGDGYTLDLGGSAHILIHLTPIVAELELARYGLVYLPCEPMFWAPTPEGRALRWYSCLERTVAALESVRPGQGEAYRRFVEAWRPLARAIADAFLAAPTPWELGRRFVLRRGLVADWRRALPRLLRPAETIAREAFADPTLRAALLWLAAQSGPPPSAPHTAPFLLWQPLYHDSGVARPRGGSGQLAVALARALVAHGGRLELATAVERIVVERGRAVGVVARGQLVRARAVLSGAPFPVTLDLLPPLPGLPERSAIRPGNGFGLMLRLALDAPVRYRIEGEDLRRGLALLCADVAQIDRAYGDFLAGRPASDPPLVAMTFAAVDPSLAPPGREVLWLWAQYVPYRLAEGTWADRAAAVAEAVLARFEAWAPGSRASVRRCLVQHPVWLERHLGLPAGNVMHLEMTLDQMFALRPWPGWSAYRTPLPGLYLTGASTHPGGGIMGASGRNAARRLLRDLDRGRV